MIGKDKHDWVRNQNERVMNNDPGRIYSNPDIFPKYPVYPQNVHQPILDIPVVGLSSLL